MATIAKNTVFTNVGETSDGGVWWEGLDPPAAGITLTDWHGKSWKQGSASAPWIPPTQLLLLPLFHTFLRGDVRLLLHTRLVVIPFRCDGLVACHSCRWD